MAADRQVDVPAARAPCSEARCGRSQPPAHHYLATPLDIARSLPRHAHAILGYAACDAIDDLGGYLGTVELQDPVELIARGTL